jgi:hypothetical protein
MSKHALVCAGWLACLPCAAAALAAAAAPLNIKPGLWEMSTTVATSGSMMPPAMLAQMSPAQRARIEAATKQRSAGGGGGGAAGGAGGSTKACLSKEDLARGSIRVERDEDHKNCQYRVVSQTATYMETHFQCKGQGARNGELKLEAQSPEQLKGAIQVQSAKGKTTMQIAGRWLGSSCAGTKD